MLGPSSISTPAPTGLADSKALSPKRREQLVQPIQAWAHASAVGHATSQEIDKVGIMGALRLAGQRALGQIWESSRRPNLQASTIIILDGNFDWLSTSLIADVTPSDVAPSDATPSDTTPPEATPPVQLVIKGDSLSASIAAASVLAKVTRDQLMTDLHESHPEYQWASNKGYASTQHQEAIRRLGPSRYHRVSWRLPQ
jgi:ribonuclease HII